MLPKNSMNLFYPKSETNLTALLDFYFFDNTDVKFDGINEFLLKEHRTLTLNQIEFMCRKIVEAFPIVFKANFKRRIQLRNLFKYAIDALIQDEIEWRGSRSRLRITHEFKSFVSSSEVDIRFLEQNN